MELLPASAAAVSAHRMAGEPRGQELLCANPEEAGRAHGCVWDAGDAWAGDTPSCKTVELALPLFSSVSSAGGGSGSACP